MVQNIIKRFGPILNNISQLTQELHANRIIRINRAGARTIADVTAATVIKRRVIQRCRISRYISISASTNRTVPTNHHCMLSTVVVQ